MKVFFKIYRTFFSPALHALGGPNAGCRFHPTCSEYAEESFEKHGLIKGFFLALLRVLRCNPFSKGGFDPVGRS